MSYYGYDGHGDVRSLMDNRGAVTDTYDYDAYGNVVTSTGTTANVYRYQGEALDAETGLYYLRARYYDPVAGRFLRVDSMADEDQHPYTYAGADPVNGHDPTGRQDIIEYSLLMWLFTAHVPPPRDQISCFGAIVFSNLSPAEILARMGMACQIRGGGSQGNPPGPKKKGRVKIRVKVIDDQEAHPKRSNKGMTADERAKEQRLLSYTRQAMANTEIDMDVKEGDGLVTLNAPDEPSADRNSLNLIFSTATPYGKTNAGVSTPNGPPWISWIDIDDAHEHARGVPSPWPGIPPVAWLGWTQTVVHEMVHILLRTGNESIVDYAALYISLGGQLDSVKQGACGREFTISCS